MSDFARQNHAITYHLSFLFLPWCCIERTDELQNSTKDLEQQLEEQEQEAVDAISQWERRYSEITEGLNKKEEALVIARAELDELQKQKDDVVRQLTG